MTYDEICEFEAGLESCAHCQTEQKPMLLSTQAGRHWITCRECQMQTPIGQLNEVRALWNSRRIKPEVKGAFEDFAKATAEMARAFAMVMRQIETEGQTEKTKE